jgi:curli biogenesis system outer membrane secretion channel CsgG
VYDREGESVRRVILALMVLATALGARAEFLAYAVSDKGRTPLPERIDEIEAKHLVNVEWGAFAGRRSRVGVLEVDNNSSAQSFTVQTSSGESIDFSSNQGGMVPVNGIEAIVIDVMNQTGRFRLVERNVLGDVLGEQDLAASGRVAAPSGAATGNVLGAEYLVQVVITDYEANVKGTQGGGLGGLFGGAGAVLGAVGVKRGEGRVGMNIRLIDAETSEVVFTKQIESVIKEGGITFGGFGVGGGGALGGFMSSYSKTPIGQAVIAGINEGVYELAKQIGARPAEGSVVKAEGNRVWLNLGAEAVSVGDALELRRKGEELVDPETGISLGSTSTTLGRIEVVQVEEKFSIARGQGLEGTPQRGDLAVSLAPPPSVEFASAFQPPG